MYENTKSGKKYIFSLFFLFMKEKNQDWMKREAVPNGDSLS
jgi:hypothetical protein